MIIISSQSTFHKQREAANKEHVFTSYLYNNLDIPAIHLDSVFKTSPLENPHCMVNLQGLEWSIVVIYWHKLLKLSEIVKTCWTIDVVNATLTGVKIRLKSIVGS